MSTRPELGPLGLARGTVDAAGHRRRDDDWLAEAWADPSTRVLVIRDGRTSSSDGHLRPVSPAEAPPGDRVFLGVEGDTAWFAVLAAEEWPDGTAVAGLREIGLLLSDRDAGLLARGVALANWHATHPRCARCGEGTEVVDAGHLRRCRSCGAEHFPRTDPAVIVLVTDDEDRALLGRSPRWPAGRFSTLAGFVEPGESAEAAVVREVGEEVGLVVTDVVYLGSQPWPFPASLMLGFAARAPEPARLTVDGTEIVEARWFTRPDLLAAVRAGDVVLAPGLSIARRLIERWWGDRLPDGPARRW